ncbi:MAG: HNH endonuclease [Akkermansiaceae bacterium]
MGISQKDIKLLWGRAGNRCSICQRELSLDSNADKSSHLVGEQAHIIGEKDSAARGDSYLDLNERNTYHNLILLCPTHHVEIDKNVNDWSVERLYQQKSQHELWVNESLSCYVNSSHQAAEATITSIIDSAVELLNFEDWCDWLYSTLPPRNQLPYQLSNTAPRFLDKLAAAVWPEDCVEFRVAATQLGKTLNHAIDTFLRHAELRGDYWWGIKFYKEAGWNKNYKQDVERYKEWEKELSTAFYESTKAANWFCDIVRKDINPMFFTDSGRFHLAEEHANSNTIEGRVPLYTKEEIAQLIKGKNSST